MDSTAIYFMIMTFVLTLVVFWISLVNYKLKNCKHKITKICGVCDKCGMKFIREDEDEE